MKKVCEYEIGGSGLLPLHNKSSLSTEEISSDTDSETLTTACHQPSFLHMHPHLTSCKQLEAMRSKAHLVMRLIETRIGQEPLLQVKKTFVCLFLPKYKFVIQMFPERAGFLAELVNRYIEIFEV
jgi:hypothetical protein